MAVRKALFKYIRERTIVMIALFQQILFERPGQCLQLAGAFALFCERVLAKKSIALYDLGKNELY